MEPQRRNIPYAYLDRHNGGLYNRAQEIQEI